MREFSPPRKIKRNCCPRCGHQPKPVRSRGYYLRIFLKMISRDRNNDLRPLPCDDEGKEFFKVMLALGLPEDEVDQIVPWFKFLTLRKQRKIRKAAKRFDPTSTNIGVAIKFTSAEREWYGEKYRIWLIRAYDKDWNAEQREREKRKNARRGEKRRETRAQRAAQIEKASHDPRRAAVLAAIDRLSHQTGCRPSMYVRDIMDDIAKRYSQRGAFPTNGPTFRRVIYRAIGRLAAAGQVQTRRDERGRLRCTITAENGCDSVTAPKIAGLEQKAPNDGLNCVRQAVTPHDPDQEIAGATPKGLEANLADRHKDHGQEGRLAGTDQQQAPVMTDVSTVTDASSDTQQEQVMTREQREQARLEMEYLKRRIAELEKLFDAEEKRPIDPTEPHRTLQ